MDNVNIQKKNNKKNKKRQHVDFDTISVSDEDTEEEEEEIAKPNKLQRERSMLNPKQPRKK